MLFDLSGADLPPAVAELAAEVRGDLHLAHLTLRELDACAAEDPDRVAAFESAFGRMWEIYDRAAHYLGAGADHLSPAELSYASGPKECSQSSFESLRNTAEAAARDAKRTLARLEFITSRGLWIGGWPLCDRTVEAAEMMTDGSGRRALRLNMRAPLSGSFRVFTAAFADPPRRILIRIDGRMVMEPVVYEATNILELTGPSEEQLREMQAAAVAPCHTPP